MHVQMLISVLHLSLKTQTTPAVLLFCLVGWLVFWVILPGLHPGLVFFLMVMKETAKYFGNFSHISFCERGVQQACFQPHEELCHSYIPDTMAIPRQAPRQEQKEPCDSGLFCSFQLESTEATIHELPIPTSPEHKGCRNSSSGIVWTEGHNSKGSPWPHFQSLVSRTKLQHIINPRKWSEQQAWQSSSSI